MEKKDCQCKKVKYIILLIITMFTCDMNMFALLGEFTYHLVSSCFCYTTKVDVFPLCGLNQANILSLSQLMTTRSIYIGGSSTQEV